jgi:hypothetical protein
VEKEERESEGIFSTLRCGRKKPDGSRKKLLLN